MHIKKPQLLVLLWMVSLSWLGAQSTGFSGLVRDLQGGRIPDATVLLTSETTGRTRSTHSDLQGRYRYTAVAPGEYRIAAQHPGFRTVVQTGIRVTIDRHTVVNLTLRIGELIQEMVIAATPNAVETRADAIGGLVDERRVSDLPLNGRDWLQLAELHPGVVRARSTGAGNTSNQSNARISVSGQRPNATNFFLDGTDISVYSQSRPPGSVSQGLVMGVEAIREFRIVTSGYSAEYGGKSGGLIDVITKSGGNDLHGSAFWFHRNDSLDARNFFDRGPLADFSRHQFGASLGGPLVRGKTFFFLNYEGFRETKDETSSDVTPNQDARNGLLPDPLTGQLESVGVDPDIRPYLDLFPLPNGPDFGNGTALWSGNASRRIDEDFFSVRLDHDLTARDTIYGRYTFDHSHADSPFGGSTAFPGFPRFNTGRDQVLTIGETHTFSPTVLNTLRFGFNRRLRLTGPQNPDPGGLAFSLVDGSPLGDIRVGGIGRIGNSARAVANLINNVFHVTESLSVVTGRHSLKMGLDLARIQLNDTLKINENGTIRFSGLEGFLANRPSRYSGVLSGADYARGLRFTRAAFYVQDSIDVHSNFTLNLGLRYEPWSNVSEVNGKLPILLDPLSATGPESFQVSDRLFLDNPSKSNWAPRVGFAWDLFGDGRTSLRGGFGTFFDTPYNGDLLDPVLVAPPFVTPVEVSNPGFPDILGGGTGNTPQLAAPVLEYSNFNWPTVHQFHLALQRELFSGTVLTVSYNGMRANHLVSRRELNTRIPEILPDGREFYATDAPRRNPAVGSMTLFTSDAKAWYDGLQMNLNRRLSHGLSLLFGYTFSKALDQAPPAITFTEISGGPKIRMDSDDLPRDKGLGTFHVAHAATTSLLWDLPVGRGRRFGSGLSWPAQAALGGWSVSSVVVLNSGHPFTPRISFNNSRSGVQRASASNVDRPDLNPGFSGNPVIGDIDQWYDPAAFQLPQPGFFGNLGRNTLIGPGLSNVDIALLKDFRVSETTRIQFRAEFFNAFNHPNFDLPGSAGNLNSGSFIFTNSSGQPNLGATRPIRTINDPREIQFALKFLW